MQIFAIVVSLAIAVVGIALFVRAIRTIIGVIKVGQPAARTDHPAGRTVTLLKESLLHTRMLQWTWVGIGHWFVFVGFGLLFFTLVTAFGQLFDAALRAAADRPLLPVGVGLRALHRRDDRGDRRLHRLPREPPARAHPRHPKGRFFGSTMWQGYFVEGVILGVGLCIVALRGLEYALLTHGGEHAGNASPLHFPLSFPLGEAFSGLSTGTIENAIYLVAMLKIVISFAWMITISLTPTMGVAWHRFLAFFNIWFKRESSGRTALGRGQAAHLRRQGDHARRHRRPRRGLRARRRAGSRTSAGRASSTSPRAPSAAAASRSAPRGTPRSRCPPSSSSPRCATTPTRRRRTSRPAPTRSGRPCSRATTP